MLLRKHGRWQRVSADSGEGLVMRYFLDAIGCGYRHGASPENYLVLRFYELKDAERYQYLTSGRSSRQTGS